MINDEELRTFHDWLQTKSNDSRAALALRWIADFEAWADADEDEFVELKEFLKTSDHPDAAAARKFIAWVEETTEVEPRLVQFGDWLEAKGNDFTASLLRWWLAEFELAREGGKSLARAMATLQ